jgi:hypothetical protein
MTPALAGAVTISFLAATTDIEHNLTMIRQGSAVRFYQADIGDADAVAKNLFEKCGPML